MSVGAAAGAGRSVGVSVTAQSPRLANQKPISWKVNTNDMVHKKVVADEPGHSGGSRKVPNFKSERAEFVTIQSDVFQGHRVLRGVEVPSKCARFEHDWRW